MTRWEIICLIFGGLLAAAGAVNTIGAAIEKAVKAWRAAKSPNDKQDQRIKAVEEAVEELRREASLIRSRLDDRDDGMTIMFKSLLALLGHGIDGNNVQEMRDAKQEMQNYLIKK